MIHLLSFLHTLNAFLSLSSLAFRSVSARPIPLLAPIFSSLLIQSSFTDVFVSSFSFTHWFYFGVVAPSKTSAKSTFLWLRFSGPLQLMEHSNIFYKNSGNSYSPEYTFSMFNNIHLQYFTLFVLGILYPCLLYTSPSPRDQRGSRMPSSA